MRGTVAVIGAGDFIGSAIARKFAGEGFTVVPLIRDPFQEIWELGGRAGCACKEFFELCVANANL